MFSPYDNPATAQEYERLMAAYKNNLAQMPEITEEQYQEHLRKQQQEIQDYKLTQLHSNDSQDDIIYSDLYSKPQVSGMLTKDRKFTPEELEYELEMEKKLEKEINEKNQRKINELMQDEFYRERPQEIQKHLIEYKFPDYLKPYVQQQEQNNMNMQQPQQPTYEQQQVVNNPYYNGYNQQQVGNNPYYNGYNQQQSNNMMYNQFQPQPTQMNLGVGYNDPYYNTQNTYNPYGQQTYNPYGQQQSYNPYGQQTYNPYGQQQTYNPYGQQQQSYTPYGYVTNGYANPFTSQVNYNYNQQGFVPINYDPRFDNPYGNKTYSEMLYEENMKDPNFPIIQQQVIAMLNEMGYTVEMPDTQPTQDNQSNLTKLIMQNAPVDNPYMYGRGYYGSSIYNPYMQNQQPSARQQYLDSQVSILKTLSKISNTACGIEVEDDYYDRYDVNPSGQYSSYSYKKPDKLSDLENEELANLKLMQMHNVNVIMPYLPQLYNPNYQRFVQEHNTYYDKMEKLMSECKTLKESFDMAGAVFQLQDERKLEDMRRSTSNIYNTSSFKNLCRGSSISNYFTDGIGHKKSAAEVINSMNPNISIDDMEITLPPHLRNSEYTKKRDSFFSFIDKIPRKA